jgi:hypothetical protein
MLKNRDEEFDEESGSDGSDSGTSYCALLIESGVFQ